MKHFLHCACALLVLCAALPLHAASEPDMAEYTHYPIFKTEKVMPRIMLALDNSGSMNFPAYGNEVEDWPNAATLAKVYDGRICSTFSGRVNSTSDDGMQRKSNGQIILCNTYNTLTMLDFDLGTDDDSYPNPNSACTRQTMLSALRFTNIPIPREVAGVPAKIESAYIEFTARTNNGPNNAFKSAALNLKITAQAADNPSTLTTAVNDISSRPDTAASVTWNLTGAWTTGTVYQSPELKTIVQELVSRPGWNSGQAMLFKIDWVSGAGGRVANAFDSNASLAPRLVIVYEPCEINRYYGYFNPDGRYTYTGNRFKPDPAGVWDGNFLNFLCMRRGDIVKKVVVGGETTAIAGTTNLGLKGISATAGGNARFRRRHTGTGVSPWADAWYFMDSGRIDVRASSDWAAATLGQFNIVVEKISPNLYPADPARDSASDFGPDNLPGGVMQKVGDRAAWGTAWFLSSGDGNASIDKPMKTPISTIIPTIRSKAFETSTPLSELLYVVTQYFKQQNPEITGFTSTASGSPFTNIRDPYFSTDGTVQEACAQGFCLLVTDGMSTNDQQIPTYLKNYAGLPPMEALPSNGSSYARDVGFYMNSQDLRGKTIGKNILPGYQNVRVYVVYAFGADEKARDLLKDTAKYGGFKDSDDSKTPNLRGEWDKNNDNLADNYYEAKDGAELEKALLDAILAMVKSAGSGTAVSVLATKGEGEGTLVQAIFEPSKVTNSGDVTWLGQLHSLWVDNEGHIREDSVGDYKLNTNEDKRIVFGKDQECDDEGDCVDKGVVFWTYSNDGEQGAAEPLDAMRSIWSAGDKLADLDPIFRKIYTYSGPGTEADPHVNFIELSNNFWNQMDIIDYLGVNAPNDLDNKPWGYLGADEIQRTVNLMRWIQGFPTYVGGVNLRRRTMDDGRLWKLGDIIHSTPTSVAQPLADYDLLYNDASYYTYYMKNRSRETAVYVGSNAGMLHCFTGWVYNNDRFVNPYDVPGYFTSHTDTTAGNVEIGSELWAFIPQSLLPHLKWLADPDYTHVNYIDLRPRVFDAKIFTPSARNPNGWGTVLVCGLGFAGGMQIPCNPNHPDPAKRITIQPSFFAIDITEPRDPVFLWERSFPNMGMSANYPNLVKVGDNWMLAIGSGPNSMDANSSHPASLIVVDLKTGGDTARGGLKKIFTLPGGNAFANEPVAFDKSMNYNVDAVYVAANYNTGSSQVFRLTIPQKNNTEFKAFDPDGGYPEYVDNPADPAWTITKMVKSPRPITASGTLSVDRKDNAWLYLGTGRFITLSDKTNTTQNYIMGVKDPFFNPDLTACNYSYPAVECEINRLGTVADPMNDLFDAGAYEVFSRSVVEGPDGEITFDDMVLEARRNVYQGWYRTLQYEIGVPSERVVNKGAVLGGIMLMPTFMPDTDPCRAGGSSRLFAVYYETGTAFFRKVFKEDSGEGAIMDVISLGDGIASSLSIHSGRQTGGKVYVQKSTGEILEVDVNPAFNIKSGPEYWLDDGYY